MNTWTTKKKVARNKENRVGQREAAKLGLRYCTKCKKSKPFLDFDFPAGARSKKAWCTECRSVKECSKCHNVLPRAAFQLSNGSQRVRSHSYCLDCDRRYQREWKLQNNYSLSTEDVAAMEQAQGGACYLCNSKVKLVVDHDHSTGKVRRLLCNHCNRGLGYFRDDPDALRKAADYIERFTCE